MTNTAIGLIHALFNDNVSTAAITWDGKMIMNGEDIVSVIFVSSLHGSKAFGMKAGLHVALSQHAAVKIEATAGEIGPRGKSQNMNTWATNRALTQGFKRG
jgi:hypothetical protein